jgi:mRNA interferase RelE/StbE
MSYRIRVSDAAEREVRRLPGHVRQRAKRAISALAEEPRPPGSKELRDRPGLFRLRLEGWRIIYRIDDDNQVVRIIGVRVKTGPETYEDLQ